jgi:hypothetical protein
MFGSLRRARKRGIFSGRRPVSFLFLAAAVVLIATALAVQYGAFRPEALFPEAEVEDWRADLPAAWAAGGVTSLAVSDDARPTRLVGWSDGVALIVWDRASGRYGVTSSIAFDSIYPGLQGPPTLTKAAFEADLPVAVANLKLGEAGRAAAFFKVSGRSVEVLRLIDYKGDEQDAVMKIGDGTGGTADLKIRDTDGDGGLEAVVTSRTYKPSGPGAGWGSSVDVYRWQDGVLVYDSKMSWALTMESSIFPEPSDQVDSSSATE